MTAAGLFVCFSQVQALDPHGASHAGGHRAKDTVYYVSLRGDDAWTGKLADPNATNTDGPFATLTRARDAIRELQAHRPLRKPVTVYLRGGVYTLTSTAVFLPQDSGTAECPITYAAFAGETVVLSGGRAITGWKQAPQGGQQDRSNLWTAEVPGVKEGEWYFHQLFVNGQRRQRARSPNTGFFHADGEFQAGDPARFRFRPGDIHAAWVRQGDVEIVGLEKWAEFRMPLTAVDAATSTATLATKRQPFGDDKDARYWVENAADALDAPGEWYLDRRTGTLSYLALPGEDVAHEQFLASFLPQLVRLQGTERTSDFIHDVNLRGLTFAYTDWSLPAKGYVDTQAAYDIPAAVELQRARHCRIERCAFTHLGQYAVHVWKGSHDNEVTDNEMTDLGAGGVKVGGWFLPENEELATTGTRVANNDIHNIGIVYPAAVGVWIGQSSGNTVAHNDIYDTYYTGVSLGWTWGYGRSAAHDNHIEFNRIYNIGRGLLSDMGCIYSLGIQPGSVERNNVCHDVSRFAYGGWGIYTDEGSSQILIEDNVVYRTQDAGLHQHYGMGNVIRNNIFALGTEAQIQRSRATPRPSFSFEHNIIYWTQGKLLRGKWDDGQFHMDYNLYWPAAGQAIEFGKLSLAEWQQHGQDVHSIVANPLFVNAEHGDFTLRASSPAGKIGFAPIDMGAAGRKPY